MLRRRKLRRAIGAILVVAGALLMLLAPESTFGVRSSTGLALLIAGIALEIAGIALERRTPAGKR